MGSGGHSTASCLTFESPRGHFCPWGTDNWGRFTKGADGSSEHKRDSPAEDPTVPSPSAAGPLGLPRTSRKSWGRAESPHPFISAAQRELCALYLPSQLALHLLAGEVQALESVQLDLLLPLLFEDHEKIGLWLVGHDPDL